MARSASSGAGKRAKTRRGRRLLPCTQTRPQRLRVTLSHGRTTTASRRLSSAPILRCITSTLAVTSPTSRRLDLQAGPKTPALRTATAPTPTATRLTAPRAAPKARFLLLSRRGISLYGARTFWRSFVATATFMSGFPVPQRQSLSLLLQRTCRIPLLPTSALCWASAALVHHVWCNGRLQKTTLTGRRPRPTKQAR